MRQDEIVGFDESQQTHTVGCAMFMNNTHGMLDLWFARTTTAAGARDLLKNIRLIKLVETLERAQARVLA